MYKKAKEKDHPKRSKSAEDLVPKTQEDLVPKTQEDLVPKIVQEASGKKLKKKERNALYPLSYQIKCPQMSYI